MRTQLKQQNQYRKMSFKQLFAYGCGDLGDNVAFGVMTGMITFFYTDYAGVAASLVALVLAVSRLPDAISDLLMGLIVEKTHTKIGKARPWIKRIMIPLAISVVLLFCVPASASTAIKVVYMFITYNLCCTVFFTAFNLPYSTLSSMMTRDTIERTKLCSARMAMAPWGRVFAVSISLPMVKALGDNQRAWIIVMCIWAAVSLIPLVFCYRTCDEVVAATPEDLTDTKISSGKAILTCLKNPYWWAIGLMWGVTAGHYGMIGASLPYYCKYILGNDSYYTLVYTTELVIWSVVALLTPKIMQRFKSKSKVCMVACMIAVAAQFIFWKCTDGGLVALEFVTIIRSFCTGIPIVLTFSMMSDVVEFAHWKYHVRQEGMIFSATGIFYKAFSALAAAAAGTLMTIAGYISSTGGVSVIQPDTVYTMIPRVYSGGIILMWGFVAILMAFWKIDKNYAKIMSDLEARKARGEL